MQEKSDADEFIKNQRKIRLWGPPGCRSLGDGIGELRWESEDKQHRLVGFFASGVWFALIGCTHKQRRYNPTDCLHTAKKRKAQIERNEVTTVEYDL